MSFEHVNPHSIEQLLTVGRPSFGLDHQQVLRNVFVFFLTLKNYFFFYIIIPSRTEREINEELNSTSVDEQENGEIDSDKPIITKSGKVVILLLKGNSFKEMELHFKILLSNYNARNRCLSVSGKR